MTVFVPIKRDVKLNFCCNEIKFNLNLYIYANTTDVVKNFAVIKSVSIKKVDCNLLSPKGIHNYTCIITITHASTRENLSSGVCE